MKRRNNMVLESTHVRGISPEGLVLTRSDLVDRNSREDSRERSQVLEHFRTDSYRGGVK